MGAALPVNYRQAQPLAMRKLTAAQIGAAYTLAGSVFGQGVVTVFLISSLNGDVVLSFDGVTDFIELPSNASIAIDLATNKIALQGNLGIYLKDGSTAAGTGYVSVGLMGVA